MNFLKKIYNYLGNFSKFFSRYVKLIRLRFKTYKIFHLFFKILFFVISPINYIITKLIRIDLITTGYDYSAKN